MPTNHYFSPRVRSEQMLYEDIIIESLRMYGQDVYYIPRTAITTDDILNETFSKYDSAYAIEMYIANTSGFEGDGNLLSKFGLEIRDQATFIVARRRFEQLVDIDQNKIASERPREGDLIYLPLSNSLFEIKSVEHEQPFYRLEHLPTYELQCELFEYSGEEFDTGVGDIDEFESKYSESVVLEIIGGTTGFDALEPVKQIITPETLDSAGAVEDPEVSVIGEVVDFRETVTDDPANSVERQGLLRVASLESSVDTITEFSVNGSNILDERGNDTGWRILDVRTLSDEPEDFDVDDPISQSSDFEIAGDSIIDFSEINPFGEPTEGN